MLLKEALEQNCWARDIVSTITTQVLCIWAVTRGLTLNHAQPDQFIWKWSSDGKYSTSSKLSSLAPHCCSEQESHGRQVRR